MAYDKQNKSGEVYPSIRARIRPPEVSIVVMCKGADGSVKVASTPAHMKKAIEAGFDVRIIVCNVITMLAGVIPKAYAKQFISDWIVNMYDTQWFPEYVEVSARGENVGKQDEHPSKVQT